ncbi:unnamed protein product [Amoebophrya sp. A120]|nr:unnamed protein product [Amoebophrya sp. A120]|eukprot:GSA120T00000613001.1
MTLLCHPTTLALAFRVSTQLLILTAIGSSLVVAAASTTTSHSQSTIADADETHPRGQFDEPTGNYVHDHRQRASSTPNGRVAPSHGRTRTLGTAPDATPASDTTPSSALQLQSEAGAKTKEELTKLVDKQDKEFRDGLKKSIDLVKASEEARDGLGAEVGLYVRLADVLRTELLEFVSEGRRDLFRMEESLTLFSKHIERHMDRNFYEPPANYGEFFFPRFGGDS